MEKALGMRLIVCCLGHFFRLLSNAFPDFGSVGRSVEKEKKAQTPPPPQKKKKKKKLEKKSRTRRPSTSA